MLLGWTPGFDGGLPSSFRIRYKSVDSPVHMFTDVFPRNATLYQVGNLQVGTEYVFSIMAYNDKGDSNYTTEQVQIKTSGKFQMF